jgi:hypothetical protein
MFKFLREDSNISSMRVTLFLGTLCICLLCAGIFTYTLIHAFKCTVLDWSGMSIFLTAIAAFAGTLLYGKVQQKKVENKPIENL